MERIPSEDYKNKTYPCKKCGVNTVAKPKTDDPVNEVHGYKLYCMDCGTFVGWSGIKKEIVKNGERQFSSQWRPSLLGIDYCQICLRNATEFGQTEKLEPHHIIEISAGGKDDLENIMWLCSCCHRLVHHQRTYLQKHLKHHAEAYKAIQTVKTEKPDLYNAIIEACKESRVTNE